MVRLRVLLWAVPLLALVASAAAADVADEAEALATNDKVVRLGGRSLLGCQANAVLISRRCVCKPGYGYKNFPPRCIACNPGYYKYGYGNGSCKPCPSGQYVGYQRAPRCLPCKSGLVDPLRIKCQRGCNKPKDGTIIHYGPYWGYNYGCYYRGYPDGNSSFPIPSAAQVCDSLRHKPYPYGGKNLIPAVIKSSAQAKIAAKLAEYAFACKRKPFGSPGYEYGYFSWILKGYDTPYWPPVDKCNYLFHKSGNFNSGKSFTWDSDRCFGPDGTILPVLCSQGCARWCYQCGSHGRCNKCVDGYTPNSDGFCTPEPVK